MLGPTGRHGMVGNLKRRVAAVILAALFAANAAVAGDTGPIRLGLQPTNATLSLLALYHPLRLHLQQALGRPVELYTSRTFRDFLDQVATEDFDAVVAAPHFGVVALDHGYLPLLRYQPALRPVILLAKDSPIRTGADLKGRRILTADRLTAVSVVAERWLEEDFGLIAGRDYTLVEASNHLTAIRAVAIGDAEAAITTRPAFTQAPAEIVAKLTQLHCGLTIPGQFTMAHERLGPDTIARLNDALLSFAGTESGRAFFAKGYGGFVPLTAEDVAAARPYSKILARLLSRAGQLPAPPETYP